MFKRIVVGTDGSETAAEAVRQATELAKQNRRGGRDRQRLRAGAAERLREEAQRGAGRHRPHVGPREDVNRTSTAAAGAGQEAGVEVNTHAREGDPADAILDVAEEIEADLIVVGNKGMTGAKRFLLGSVPNKVSHHAPCGVYIVRTT